ncbi:MAG: amino-acid N-acetyltransferase [Gammaproteobacteria bacterium]|nr:MAG: amino-acid N-acetyltransferase [Pseudomonadota bacterium]PIE38403.1 MAG: amino-acid N-acetyltransferase [Gammaproteobacteria bacterium]
MPDITFAREQDWLFWFRQSSPYINAHRGKTVVLAFSGSALEHDNLVNIIHDIVLLNSLGVRIVLVFGARPQIDFALASAGIETRIHHNLRVTPESAMPCVMQAVGGLRGKLEARLSTGTVTSPMYGAGIRVVSGNFVFARPIGVLDGIDLCYTGKVRKVDRQGISSLLDQGAIVLLPSIGYSLTGEAFNLGYEDVAASVASAMDAEKLIIFSEQQGILDSDGELVRELSLQEAEEMIRKSRIGNTDGEIPGLLSQAVRAGRKGVRRSHIISYESDGALLGELFTRDGSGTMIYDDEYEQIRPATIEDIGGILDLLQPLEEKGILIRRSREKLETEIANFTVDRRDGSVIGCAALYGYPDDAIGELACFAVAASYRKEGRGDGLLRVIEKQAREKRLARLFVLTTQTEHWFRERGFQLSDVNALPEQKKASYNAQRNAKVFIKKL